MTRHSRLSLWASERERGSAFLLRPMAWVSLSLSQVLAEGMLLPITAWFLVTSPGARAASRDYLRRALDRPARINDIARHFFEFARVILDRAHFMAGRAHHFETEFEGLEHLNQHIEAGRGCVLLGAHLGSFDAMRAMARSAPVHVRPAMYRANAGALTAIMERLDPQLAADVIDIGKPGAMLQVRESLERGDLVAFLADRATDPRRLIAMPFFGEPAMFPTGPFQIAAMLRAPVVMFHGIRTGRRHYLLRFEPLSGSGSERPADRTEALRQIMGGYVTRLEAACRAYPFQWFNFYSFWRQNALSEPRADGVARDLPPASATLVAD
jgi:predicted LPLAT superfamily acyltransferase